MDVVAKNTLLLGYKVDISMFLIIKILELLTH